MTWSMHSSLSAAGLQVNFSPDGKFLMSGDSVGKLFFWEWAHPNRVVKTLPAHDKVRIACMFLVVLPALQLCVGAGLILFWCYHLMALGALWLLGTVCTQHGKCAPCSQVTAVSF